MSIDSNRDSETELALVCKFISGRQQHPRGPQSVADLMSSLLARRGYAQVHTSADNAAAWQQAVGSRHAANTVPGSIRRGILEVVVRNSAAMQELTFDKARILKTLRTLLPDQKIKDIRFKVGAVD